MGAHHLTLKRSGARVGVVLAAALLGLWPAAGGIAADGPGPEPAAEPSPTVEPSPGVGTPEASPAPEPSLAPAEDASVGPVAVGTSPSDPAPSDPAPSDPAPAAGPSPVAVALGPAPVAAAHSEAPASVTRSVTNNADSGAGSFRDALATDPGAPLVVQFSSSFAISLLSAIVWTFNQTLTINGSGSTVVAGPNDRILDSSSTVPVEIEGMTLQGGSPTAGSGGAVRANGDVTVRNTTFQGNSAQDNAPAGGGIFSTGNVTVADSTFTDNSAVATGTDPVAQGGAVYAGGSLTVSNSTFTDNAATATATEGSAEARGGAGFTPAGAITLTNSTFKNNDATALTPDMDATATGGAVNGQGTVTVSGSVFSNNSATASTTGQDGNAGAAGGGIFNMGHVSLANSTFRDNSADATASGSGTADASSDGGAVAAAGSVAVTGGTLTNNTATASGGGLDTANGGAISAHAQAVLPYTASVIMIQATVFILDAVLAFNAAHDSGGAVFTNGNAVLMGATLSQNVALKGGGVHAGGDVTVIDSTLTSNGNSLGLGGGLYTDGSAVVTASTFSGNVAGSGGGAIAGGDFAATNSTIHGNMATAGGGLDIGGNLSLTNVTMAGNSASAGAGVLVGGDFTSRGSVFAGPLSGPNCSVGGTTSSSYSYSTDGSCAFAGAGDVVNGIDPGLGALGNNGGPTPTMLPAAGSPLVNVIPIPTCFVDVDQRGIPRPQSTGCEIGAVEVILSGLAVAKTPGSQSVPYGGSATFTITVTNTGDVDLTNVVVADAVSPVCGKTVALLAARSSTSYQCTVSGLTTSFTNVLTATASEPFGAQVSAMSGEALVLVAAAAQQILISESPGTELPFTGGNVFPLLLVAFVLFAAGGGLLLPRHLSSWSSPR